MWDVHRLQERDDAGPDVVSDPPDRLEVLAGGVLERPVLVALAGKHWAHVATAHRDHDVGGGHGVGGEDHGLLGGDVDADLAHSFYRSRVDIVCRCRLCGQHLSAVNGDVAH